MKSNKEILRFINSLMFKNNRLSNKELEFFNLIKRFLFKEVNNDVFDDFNKKNFKLYKNKYVLYY